MSQESVDLLASLIRSPNGYLGVSLKLLGWIYMIDDRLWISHISFEGVDEYIQRDRYPYLPAIECESTGLYQALAVPENSCLGGPFEYAAEAEVTGQLDRRKDGYLLVVGPYALGPRKG